MAERVTVPSRPTYAERRLTPPPWAGIAPAGAPQYKTALAPCGRWTACDVVGSVPTVWADLTVRVSIKIGQVVLPLFERRIDECEHLGWKGGNTWDILIGSVRGRPCDGFIVEVLPNAAGTQYTEGYVRIDCWHEESWSPSDNTGRQNVGLFARTDQQVTYYNLAVPNAVTTCLVPPPYGRICLTHISFVTIQGAVTNWSLESIVGAGPAVPHMQIQCHLRSAFLADLTYPLRGQLDGAWQITPLIWAANTTVNLVGYVE